MDDMFRAVTMVTAFLINLSILNHSSKSYHEFLCYSLKSIRVITPGRCHRQHLLSPNCAKCTAGFLEGGWLPLSFLKGKKLVVLGLDGLLAVWNLEPQDSSMESSFSASLAALR